MLRDAIDRMKEHNSSIIFTINTKLIGYIHIVSERGESERVMCEHMA